MRRALTFVLCCVLAGTAWVAWKRSSGRWETEKDHVAFLQGVKSRHYHYKIYTLASATAESWKAYRRAWPDSSADEIEAHIARMVPEANKDPWYMPFDYPDSMFAALDEMEAYIEPRWDRPETNSVIGEFMGGLWNLGFHAETYPNQVEIADRGLRWVGVGAGA